MHELDMDYVMRDKRLILVTGRSNVGKSSMVRGLTRIRVPVGKRPGTTKKRYIIDMGSVSVVDLPGFGYMRGQSKKRIDAMKTEIVRTIERWREQVIVAILVIDISIFEELTDRWEHRGEIPVDIEFYEFLCELFPNVIIAANKADRLNRTALYRTLELLRTKMSEVVPGRELVVILTDASSGQGIADLKQVIENILTKDGIPRPHW